MSGPLLTDSPARGDSSPATPRWLRFGFWICVVIAIAVVLRRIFALALPPQSAPPQLAALDAVFASHAALTLAHIVPALALVLVLPFALSRRYGTSALIQRTFFILGLVVAFTAYAMTRYSVGGWIERSAVLFFNTLFLFCLIAAYRQRQRRQPAAQRLWMLRATAILLGIATTRPVMGIFFATSRATHLTPQQFFGVAFWIGFSINTIAMELWLRSRNPSHTHTRVPS